MWPITWKETLSFFGSFSGLIVAGVFLLTMGLVLFFFQDMSIIDSNYASMDAFFYIAPAIFTFLIPAITMRLFAEEQQNGTIELLVTKPISDLQIILGKLLSALIIVLIMLLPTLFYYYTIYQLGSPKGNLDSGGIFGSYIGLFFLSACFVSIGLFASTLTNNQVIAFIIGVFLCFVCHWIFYFISLLPVFVGNLDYMLQRWGIDYHYDRMSKGVIDSRDVIYFLSLITFFVALTHLSIQKRKW